ncbi:hypothetical protein DL98DRAFT_152489 [Cadophora sp. DSE1049]|nr:hypothetical protein DL98DRAFT_152489 [Cadophora sp. DSE1049]
MGSLDPPVEVATELGSPVGDRLKLRCTVPDCPEDREFLTKSAWQKHKEKHTKPYTCSVPNCKHPHFGDKGGLDRHTHEVHGSQSLCCPINTCKRHIRGFHRKYNLLEHQKKCYPGLSTGMTLSSIPRQQTYIAEAMSAAQERGAEGSSPEMMAGDGRLGTSGGRLREELGRLYAQRKKIDGAIEGLERALEYLGETSP